MELFGRTRELERLSRAADDARDGRGGLILLSGEPGIGKSRLADETATYSRARGARTIWGRAWEGGGAPPFWPWIQIARGLAKTGVDAPPELSRILPELGAPAPLFAAGADRFVLLDAMLRFVRAASARSPLVLLFDDLHAADVATIQMLSFVAPECREERVLVIGTYRDIEARSTPEVGDALAALGRHGETLHLGRLDRDDAGKLARIYLALEESEIDAVHAKTEGNPLFIAETARVLASEGRRSDGSLPLSEGVRAAIRARLGRVTPELRRDLEVAAVIGREFTTTILASLVETPATVLVARLAEAAAAGFLVERMPSRFAFAHGLFREVLLAELGPRAAAIHARAAELLERDPTALSEVAKHWLAAGPSQVERALDSAKRAAEAAAATLAYAEAAELLERTLDLENDPRARAEHYLAIGDMRIRGGESRRGKDACEKAAEIARSLGDAELLVRAALGHGSDFVAGARDRELATLLEEALRAVGERNDLRARLLARLAAALQPARDPREPIRMAREALSLLPSITAPATRLAVLHNASGAMVDFSSPKEREEIDEEVVRLAVELGERLVHLRALGRLYHDHLERGDLAGAATRIDAYEMAAQPWRQPHVRMPILLGRSCLALMHGDREGSAKLVAEAKAIATHTRDPWLALAVAMHEVASLRIRGEKAELFGRAEEFRKPIDVFPDYGFGFDAMMAAQRGDAEATRAALGRLDREHVRVCMDTVLPTWVAEAAHFVSDASWGMTAEEALIELVEEWISWSGIAFIVEAPVARGLALAAAARGDTVLAKRYFARAIDEARRAGADIVVGRIEAEAGVVGSASGPSVGLVNEGEFWTVSGFDGTARVKDSRGVRMLAKLLGTPNREWHVLDLAEAGEVIDAGDAGEVLDKQAVLAYRKRLGELERDRDDAEAHHDPGRLARIRAEIEALEAEISRGIGLGGRARRAGQASERARVNVQRRMSEALKRIEDAHPPLGAHLKRAIRTGTFCSYAPERDVPSIVTP